MTEQEILIKKLILYKNDSTPQDDIQIAEFVHQLWAIDLVELKSVTYSDIWDDVTETQQGVELREAEDKAHYASLTKKIVVRDIIEWDINHHWAGLQSKWESIKTILSKVGT